MASVKPLRPQDVTSSKLGSIPDQVIEGFNYLISKNWNGESAVVKQADIISYLIDEETSVQTIIDNHWLDVEDIYREAGWNVIFDKAGFNETYASYFVFSK